MLLPHTQALLQGLPKALFNAAALHLQHRAWLHSTTAQLAIAAAPSNPMDLFDRSQKAAQRDRAAALRSDLHRPDTLMQHITDRLVDRLHDCTTQFPTAVVLGGAGEVVAECIARSRAGVQRVIHIDSSQRMLDLAQERAADFQGRHPDIKWPETQYVLGDEEQLPLEPGSVDVVISCLGLHWVNDVPGALTQIRLALKPDGLFLGAMLGGQTLQELRIACSLAQQEREGGVSAFVSPMAQVRDAGNLLTRAGLALPTVDLDTFVMHYSSAVSLVSHLRLMAESNALKVKRGTPLRRDTALAAAAAYQHLYCESLEEGESDDCIAATYQVIYMTGWSPSASTPQAAERGSATVSFKDMATELAKRGAVAGSVGEGEAMEAIGEALHGGGSSREGSDSSGSGGGSGSSSDSTDGWP